MAHLNTSKYTEEWWATVQSGIVRSVCVHSHFTATFGHSYPLAALCHWESRSGVSESVANIQSVLIIDRGGRAKKKERKEGKKHSSETSEFRFHFQQHQCRLMLKVRASQHCLRHWCWCASFAASEDNGNERGQGSSSSISSSSHFTWLVSGVRVVCSPKTLVWVPVGGGADKKCSAAASAAKAASSPSHRVKEKWCIALIEDGDWTSSCCCCIRSCICWRYIKEGSAVNPSTVTSTTQKRVNILIRSIAQSINH